MKEAFPGWEPKSHNKRVLLLKGIEIIGAFATPGVF